MVLEHLGCETCHSHFNLRGVNQVCIDQWLKHLRKLNTSNIPNLGHHLQECCWGWPKGGFLPFCLYVCFMLCIPLLLSSCTTMKISKHNSEIRAYVLCHNSFFSFASFPSSAHLCIDNAKVGHTATNTLHQRCLLPRFFVTSLTPHSIIMQTNSQCHTFWLACAEAGVHIL